MKVYKFDLCPRCNGKINIKEKHKSARGSVSADYFQIWVIGKDASTVLADLMMHWKVLHDKECKEGVDLGE